MQWAVTTPPSTTLLQFTQLAYHLRLDETLQTSSSEQTYVLDLLAAATEYAEVAMQASLLTRTITATFYVEDEITLPRGPVISLTSVTNGDGTSLLSSATLKCEGNTYSLMLPLGWSQPLVVVYQAGLTTDPTQIPADIRQAIRVHVGSMYENRESVNAGALVAVPHSLEAFYQQKCRVGVIG